MIFIAKTIAAFFISYGITCLLCDFFIKKNEYGGDGSLNCPNCGVKLTMRDTLRKSKCYKCDQYF